MDTASLDVSVVVPFRNSEQWLPRTLESVHLDLQAFDGRAELVFVDSHSTDGSRECVERFVRGQDRPARIVAATRPGAAAARNLGAATARGEWLAFVDSDDLVVAGKLAAHLECARQSGAAVVYSPFAELRHNGERWEEGRLRMPALRRDDPALSLLASENFLQVGSMLIRRSAWLGVGGMDESMPIVHDVNLYVRLAIAGHAFHDCRTVSPSLLFRQHAAGSLTTSSRSSFYADAERNADLVRDHYAAQGRLGEAHIQQGLRDAYFFLAYGYARTDPAALARVCATLDGFSCFPVPDEAGRSLKWAARLAGLRRALGWSARWTRLKDAAIALREPRRAAP